MGVGFFEMLVKWILNLVSDFQHWIIEFDG